MYAITQQTFYGHFCLVSIRRDEKVIKAFGLNLRRIREGKGFTQEDLAEKANLAVSTVGRIETGSFNSSISTIAILAKALNVDKKELVNF